MVIVGLEESPWGNDTPQAVPGERNEELYSTCQVQNLVSSPNNYKLTNPLPDTWHGGV